MAGHIASTVQEQEDVNVGAESLSFISLFNVSMTAAQGVIAPTHRVALPPQLSLFENILTDTEMYLSGYSKHSQVDNGDSPSHG